MHMLLCLLALASWTSGAGAAPALQDDFSKYAAESDGSPNWLVQDGQWRVLGGVYEQQDYRRAGVVAFSAGPAFGDMTFRVRFRAEPLGGGVRAAGMVFRAVDSRNYYYAHFDSKYSQIVLVKHTPRKKWIVIARRRRIKIAPGVWHTGEIHCKGSHFRVSLDGSLALEGDDPSFPIGRIGLRAGQGRIQFDDLTVIGEPQPPIKKWTFVKVATEFDVPRLESAERVLAARDCGYFPVMIRLQDGRLGAVIRAGARHVGIKGRLAWITSSDGGRTWSKPTTIVDGPYDDRNPSLCQAADGTIIVGYSEASTYDAKGRYDRRVGKFELFTVASKDGGKSWSARRPMNIPQYPSGSVFGRALLLPDHTILMPVYWRSDCSLLASRDHGATWTYYARVAARCNEFSLARLPNGRLVAVARSNGLSCLHSDDNGKTWKSLGRITKPNQHPGDICVLKSGHLLLVYGSRVPPYGVQAMLSRDGGRTWEAKHRVALAWDSQNVDTGYPSVVQLDDGTIVVLYYAVGTYDCLPHAPQAQCVRFTEAQLAAAGAKAK